MKYIGIIGRKIKNRITYNEEIINVIYKYNCLPICISVLFNENHEKEFKAIKPLIDKCDGFILQGGNDLCNIDILIVKYLFLKNIPTLGICLGMQTMAIAFNGKLGMINNHYSHNKYVHEINIDKNSNLFKIIKQNKILVNSRHNNYVINTDLYISSINNIIESIEDKSKKFFIGVQWHPETLMDENSLLLFDNFFYNN